MDSIWTSNMSTMPRIGSSGENHGRVSVDEFG